MSVSTLNASPQESQYRNAPDPYPEDGIDANDGHNDSADDSAADPADGSSKKRKRPMSVSCELCKQRKVKCDRGQPACGWCTRNSQLCEYKERKKPGLRAGYGRELESRLDRLEGILQNQQTAIAQLLSVAPVFAGSNPSGSTAFSGQSQEPPSSSIAQQSIRAEVRAEPAASFENSHVVSPVVQTQQGPNPFPDYSDSFHHASYAKPDSPSKSSASQAYFGQHHPNPLQSPGIGHSEQAPPVANDQDFPPYDLLYALADLYFKHVNTWCPILHRKSTLDSLFGPVANLDEADKVLLHAIVATTLRFSSDARLNKETKARFHAVSKQKVLLYGLETSSVKALQALVILALDLVGISNGPPAWNLLAIITRSAVQLGLSIEVTSQIVSPRYPSIYTLRAMVLPESKNFIEDEGRRRLFWMVYILDRYATLTTAFDFALDEKEIDRKLPCRDDLFNKNQPVETRWFRRDDRPDRVLDKSDNLGSFSYYVEIVGILSRIHQFLKKPVDIAALGDVERWQTEYRELDSVLNSWKFSLPREYGNMARLMDQSAHGKNLNCGWIMLHATYHTTIMRLHSSAAYPTHRSPIFMPSYQASQRCLTAVEQISSLCSHVRSNGMLNKLGPPFAFSVWVAARLMLVHSSTIEHQVNPGIHYFVNTLRELGEYWAVADRYASLLQRVLDETLDAERAASTASIGERITPSSVKVLADMRRNAYDLDFLISRQPKHQMPVAGPDGVSSFGLAGGRVPGGNELEYLDVFDFFNMPRLPLQAETSVGQNGVVESAYNGATGEFNNVTNFLLDPQADWFTKTQE